MELFHSLLAGAIHAGASDIHLKAGGPVIFRIRRELHPVEAPHPTAAWIQEVLGNIVPPIARARLETEHEADFAYTSPGGARFRVNVYQQRGVPVLAMRYVHDRIRTFAELQLPAIIKTIAETRRGIILLAGAPGSGKSTTLAAMIQHLNETTRRHIITLEDPIEYTFQDSLSVIEQREVGIDTASFPSGLRNVLRQDPDVLVIGEMREFASVAAAISAANLGLLVIATLHTADATRSIQRMLEFYPAAERDLARRLIASTLQAVVCQRLLTARPSGVVPAVEILINNASVAKLIEADKLDKLPGTIELGAGDGMQTFDQSLHALVTAGRITQMEALAAAPNAEALKMRLQGVTLSETRRILSARE